MSKRRTTKKKFYLIDTLSHKEINESKAYHSKVELYCWDHYTYFAHQRSLINNELKSSLIKHSVEFGFENWKRAVDVQFNDNPLSARGSILSETGGRFNIGDIDAIKFPKFAGLYLAENTFTAFTEKYGFEPERKHSGLTAEEINLAGNVSFYNVKGKLHNVIDLSNRILLEDFFSLIKNIELPKKFIQRAETLKIDPMLPVANIKELKNTFFLKNWRLLPMQFNIPANSQIFGQIAYSSGIEAILYPSAKTQMKCLITYPANFENPESFVELQGNINNNLVNKRLDYRSKGNFL